MPRRQPKGSKGKPRTQGYNGYEDHEERKPDAKALMAELPEEWGARKLPVMPVSGKDRIYSQNFKHPLYATGEADQGYAVAYQLEISGEAFEKVQTALGRKGISDEFEPHVLEFLRDGYLIHETWDRFEADLRAFSRKVRNTLLTVKACGEDLPDYYIVFALNGRSYTADAEVVYPSFEIGLLQPRSEGSEQG